MRRSNQARQKIIVCDSSESEIFQQFFIFSEFFSFFSVRCGNFAALRLMVKSFSFFVRYVGDDLYNCSGETGY